MICNKSGAKMLLRQIKSESYGVLRYKPFRPSLSAISLENQAFAELTPDFTPINVKSGVFLFLDRIIQFIV